MAVSSGLQRRLATGLNAVLVAGLVCAVVAILVDLAEDHRFRIDLSADAAASLSADTEAALALIAARGADLEVVAFSAQHRDAESWIRDRTVRDFLRELEIASDRVTTRFVDFDRDRLAAEAMGVDRYGTVLVRARGARVDLGEREIFRARGPKGARDLEFLGEASVAAAIRQVLSDGSRTLYLLSGHGEQVIWDRGLGELKGLAEVVDDQGWTARTLDLLRDTEPGAPPRVPEDAAAVVLLGPRAPLAPLEDDALRDYLAGGGSLALFAEPGGTVPSTVDELGAHVVAGLALDVAAYFPYADRPLLHYGAHPITEALAEDGIATVVAHAGAVEVEPRDGVQSAPLLQTSRRGWVERGQEQPPVYTPDEDVAGPVVVAVALERGASRVVVVADVDILGDELLHDAPGNATFVTNTLRWLVRADERFARVGRPTTTRRLALTPQQLEMIRWLVMGGMPLLAVLAGAAVWASRRGR